MRILNISGVYPPAWAYGGVPLTAHALAKALAALGHDVITLTSNANGRGTLDVPVGQETRWEDAPVVYLRRAVGPPFYAPDLRAEIRRRLAAGCVALVRGNWGYFNYAVRRESARHGFPYVLYPEGIFDPWAAGHHWVRKKIWWWLVERKNYAQAAAVVALTKAEAEQVRQMGVAARIEVIPNGVDPDEFEEFERREALDGRFPALRLRRIVLFLARLHRKKGLEQLLPAFARVVARHPDALLVLAGPDDRGYRPVVERQIREAGLDASVLLTGLVEGRTRAGLLKAAQVFVLPSYSEGLPMGALEAMACGRPVVITAHCNLPEVAEAGAGLIVEAKPEPLAAAIDRLLRDGAVAQQMGRNGMRLVRERFAWETVARMTETLCREVGGKP